MSAEAPTADDGEEWNEEDEDYDEEEVDADAEAEEIARRLNDQLWAEISKAQAEAAATAAVPVSQVSAPLPSSGPTTAPAPTAAQHGAVTQLHPGTAPSKTRHTKLGEALTTMKAILEYTAKDPLAQSTLRTTLVPNSDGSNVLDILHSTVASGSLSKELAGRLSHLLVSLARSDTLFSSLRHSNASSIQLEQGKRKREETEVELSDPRVVKRPMYQPPPSYDLHHQINEASRIITNALTPLAHPSSKDQPLDPGVIASIQLQLHQVFLFAVTSAAQGGHATHALQEIGGLIQVLGVLSGIQIGGPSAPPPPPGFPHDPSAPWIPPGHPSPFTHDIGTAVYSCPFPNCPKTFSRLFNMRTHHRAHTTVRPFHCRHCPASFARNHDLKRHVRLHGGRAWKCAGCDKVFSRRDAIMRHKKSSGLRAAGKGGKGGKGGGEACVGAEIVEVQVDRPDDDETRHARLWSGVTGGMPPNTQGLAPLGPEALEEGEIRPEVLRAAQLAVLALHPLLQACVSHSSGVAPGPMAAAPGGTLSAPELHTGQATLASIIARTQLQTVATAEAAQEQSAGAESSQEAVSASVGTQSGTFPDHHVEDRFQGRNRSSDAASNGIVSNATMPSLSVYGLSDEQAQLLQMAIANAASAAQLQAEAEAALEEQEDFDDDDFEGEESDGEHAG